MLLLLLLLRRITEGHEWPVEDRNAETRVMRLCLSKAGMAARENTSDSASIIVKIFSPADRATGLSMAAFSLLMKPYAVCVPVRPGSAPADAVFLPECRVLSVLYCGDYSSINEACLTPGNDVKAQNLTPVAPPRVLCIVAVYTGREIDTRRSYSRLVLPVEE